LIPRAGPGEEEAGFGLLVSNISDKSLILMEYQKFRADPRDWKILEAHTSKPS